MHRICWACGARTDDDRIGTVSHGNMAESVAAGAAAAGTDCTVLVPPHRRRAVAAIARYGPQLVRVDADRVELSKPGSLFEGLHVPWIVNKYP